jgi:hypothetical protein
LHASAALGKHAFVHTLCMAFLRYAAVQPTATVAAANPAAAAAAGAAAHAVRRVCVGAAAGMQSMDFVCTMHTSAMLLLLLQVPPRMQYDPYVLVLVLALWLGGGYIK